MNQKARHSLGCSVPISIGLTSSVVIGGSLISRFELTRTKYPVSEFRWSVSGPTFSSALMSWALVLFQRNLENIWTFTVMLIDFFKGAFINYVKQKSTVFGHRLPPVSHSVTKRTTPLFNDVIFWNPPPQWSELFDENKPLCPPPPHTNKFSTHAFSFLKSLLPIFHIFSLFVPSLWLAISS